MIFIFNTSNKNNERYTVEKLIFFFFFFFLVIFCLIHSSSAYRNSDDRHEKKFENLFFFAPTNSCARTPGCVRSDAALLLLFRETKTTTTRWQCTRARIARAWAFVRFVTATTTRLHGKLTRGRRVVVALGRVRDSAFATLRPRLRDRVSATQTPKRNGQNVT